MNITLLVTGGTIDKKYNELNGELVFDKTHVPEMLKQARNETTITIKTLMLMDSLDMEDADRQIIAKACREAKSKHIVITHGTDTMVATAEVIAHTVTDKTIVLTGAMIPYTFGNSDALFNLGTAIAYAQTLPPGIYIAMNGRYFPANKVTKNKKKGIFESIL